MSLASAELQCPCATAVVLASVEASLRAGAHVSARIAPSAPAPLIVQNKENLHTHTYSLFSGDSGSDRSPDTGLPVSAPSVLWQDWTAQPVSQGADEQTPLRQHWHLSRQ